jgi:hypothetical protein
LPYVARFRPAIRKEVFFELVRAETGTSGDDGPRGLVAGIDVEES